MSTASLSRWVGVSGALIMAVASTAVEAQDRYALVIGNAAYAKQDVLVNTLNDARDMAAKLRSLKFDVESHEDLGQRAMRRVLHAFLDKVARRDGVALVYFSGHGLQDDSRSNYLLPVDAQIDSKTDIPAEGFSVNRILEVLGARDRRHSVSLVILDACRNNPFSTKTRGGQTGLNRVSLTGGTLVLYAASPNQKASDNPSGRNGLFTEKLLRVMAEPGMDIENAFRRAARDTAQASDFRQEPYFEGNLYEPFYLAGGSSDPPVTPPDAELVLWQSMDRCGTLACYEAYKNTYPDGRYRLAANAHIDRLRRLVPPSPQSSPVRIAEGAVVDASGDRHRRAAEESDPAAIEAGLQLKRDERQWVQEALNGLGFEVGTADGVWGDRTRAGIRRWQGSVSRTPSGYLDGAGYKALLNQWKRRESEHAKRRPSSRSRLPDAVIVGDACADTKMLFDHAVDRFSDPKFRSARDPRGTQLDPSMCAMGATDCALFNSGLTYRANLFCNGDSRDCPRGSHLSRKPIGSALYDNIKHSLIDCDFSPRSVRMIEMRSRWMHRGDESDHRWFYVFDVLGKTKVTLHERVNQRRGDDQHGWHQAVDFEIDVEDDGPRTVEGLREGEKVLLEVEPQVMILDSDVIQISGPAR